MAKKKDGAAPLFDGLTEYAASGVLGFHTPGHTGGRLPGLSGLFGLDLTEVPVRSGGPLPPDLTARAEALAADFFGAGRTFFLGNGASLGVLAMILGTCPPGGKIRLNRDCHKSAVNACVIGDLRPSFLEPLTYPAWGFPLGVPAGSLPGQISGEEIVLLTNPTYHGVVWDLRPLAGLAGRLLVDEAHGGHLALTHPDRGARAAGALAWVHGAHKTLGSLTQTGLLHLRPGVPAENYATWLDLLSSSSPSYPLLASLDLARAWAERHGRASWDAAARRMADLRRRLHEAGITVLRDEDLPDGAYADPAKITLAAPGAGMRIADELRAVWGIQAEAAGIDWLTFLVTPFHTEAELARLEKALRQIVADRRGRMDGAGLPPGDKPERALWPREAVLAPRRSIKLSLAAGCVAAEALSPYPPGIPLIWPGEIISAGLLEYLRRYLEQGGAVSGVRPDGILSVADL